MRLLSFGEFHAYAAVCKYDFFLIYINVFNPLFAVIQIILFHKWHFWGWIHGGKEPRGGEAKFPSGLLKGFVGEEEITFASFLSAPVVWMVAPGRPAFWVAELGRAHRNTRPAKGKGKTSCKKPVNEFKKA